ncbi:HesA/MoeB/ThiF family protein [Chitinimonas sp. PSY-7]|uniref:molybdopterin-synthase adenylyltransferase MoeB n=1 Tax=Chitinimonas sp. PSY-7 TaxID=3459088 RepID=UPI00403FD24F
MPNPDRDFSDEELLRYSRHILLDEIGIEGQRKLAAASVLIVGLGGLGSPAAMYLASAGIGRLLLADADTVELTNLQRQIVHRQGSLGLAKVFSAQATLVGINPDIAIVPISERLQGESLMAAIGQADVVLDCSDNFPTRHAVNRACFTLGKPLVSGAAVRFDGQFAVFDPRQKQSPCYRCLFDEDGEASDGPCATFGVFAPLVGIIGAMQAAEAMKILLDMPGVPLGKLMVLDLRTHEWRSLRFKRDPACPVCSARN